MPTLSSALQDVVRALDACADHTPASLAAALQRPIGLDDVAPWIRFDPGNYVRNLITRTERWELRLLCWRPGQTSSLHGHGPAACAFRVLRGSATETILGSRDRRWAPGDVVAEVSADLVHQVGNTDADALLTLHAYSPALPVDAPSPREGHEVAIVGGGFGGVALATHLLRRAGRALRITLIEHGPWLGRGIAYGNDSAVFRLNVPASRMSIDPEQRDDFVRWADIAATPHAFLPRTRYGAYVVQRFGEAIRAAAGKLRVIRGEARHIDDDAVELAGGTRIPAATVVLATGLAPRLSPSLLPADPRIIDAWDECALAALPRDGRLLILGSGLTALDVIAFLNVHGFRGAASVVSRRGLLPRPHAPHASAIPPLAEAVVADAPRELRGLLRWGRAIVAETIQRGAPWQHAIDAMRPHVSRLWRGLPPRDRARFVRSVRPYWDVLRHRAPEDAHALVEAWQRDGRLERLASSVTACRPTPGGLDVTLRLAGGDMRTERYDAIVRCIGPALERGEADAPIIQHLLESGRAAADPAGLGIATDELGRVIGRDGTPSERLFALGALRRASSWETTAVPDIAAHAAALASAISRRV
jgi:uncharacterized NAD(P)/FAD-binding protein YdhS/quercetin dioxygenase-like cupin family protein